MPQTGTVTATELRLRSAPTTSADNVITKLPRGTKLQILEDQGDWLKVSAKGKTGFVSEAFVAKDVETPPADGQGKAPSTATSGGQPSSTAGQPTTGTQ